MPALNALLLGCWVSSLLTRVKERESLKISFNIQLTWMGKFRKKPEWKKYMLLDRSKTFQGWDALYFGKKPKLSLAGFFLCVSALLSFYSYKTWVRQLLLRRGKKKKKQQTTEESCWLTHTSPPAKSLLWGWQRMLGMQLWQARLVLARLKWVGGNDEEAPLFLRELTRYFACIQLLCLPLLFNYLHSLWNKVHL